MEFDFHIVNTYSAKELFAFIIKGDVSLIELRQLGLNYKIQEELHSLIDSWDKTVKEEADDWENTSQCAMGFENCRNYNGAINVYKTYFDKWSQHNPHPEPVHIQMAESEIERLYKKRETRGNELKEQLLNDMRERPDRYTPEIMRYILGQVDPDPNELDQSNAGIFLKNGLTLSMRELVDAGILPDDQNIMTSITRDLWYLNQSQIDELGSFPSDRQDIFFLGVKGSGKTCALAGIINELFDSGEVTYRPQINEHGQDRCQEYYYGLIDAVRHNKAIVPTVDDTISFMKLDIGKRREKELTFVEMSGEAFKSLSEAYSAREVWSAMGARTCLKNNNGKVLCFLVDYARVVDEGRQGNQDIALTRALTVLSSDGPDPGRPDRGCTMSKVRTVAIVVTKSDLMGQNLSYEKRRDMATEYIVSNMRAFVGTLKAECRKHNINAPNNNMVYVLPFSLGDFYVGQSVQFKKEDSAAFIKFLKDATPDKPRSGIHLFNH